MPKGSLARADQMLVGGPPTTVRRQNSRHINPLIACPL